MVVVRANVTDSPLHISTLNCFLRRVPLCVRLVRYKMHNIYWQIGEQQTLLTTTNLPNSMTYTVSTGDLRVSMWYLSLCIASSKH
jgi:hypothetical protein